MVEAAGLSRKPGGSIYGSRYSNSGCAPRQRDLLYDMYDRFDPLGGALGLPPPVAEMRRSWIGYALCQKVNVAAFSTEGRVVGHCFLVADDSESAELAVFVDQKCRSIGIGTELVKAALNWAAAVGVRRV
jgi:GNAT superfamily N-acetyltransferase